MVVTTNCSISIHRLDNGVFAEIVAGIPAFIEPASDSIIALYDDGTPGGQLYNIFCDFMGVEIGDKIFVRNKECIVRGVKKFDSLIGEHSEIVVREWKNS